jgi:small subunit ribosomal protein S4
MARYIGPVCRLCRREGVKLFLKGERCHTEKCAIEKRNFAPGQHGKDRRAKVVGYGLQLREKQKARRIYGVLERQFRKTFEEATHLKGITGENLMSLLERRLDNVVHRMGFGTSRPQARQIVRHGHVQVNGRKVNIPSYVVRPNDVVEIRDKSKKNPTILASRDATAHSPSPNWLEVDREGLKARVLANPQRADLVQIQVNDQMIVELYSK